MGGRLPHPAEIGAQVPQVNRYGVFARCRNRYRDFGTHKLQQIMPSSTNSKGKTNQNGFCAVLSGQISWQINSPCVCAIKGGVAQLTEALSNEWD